MLYNIHIFTTMKHKSKALIILIFSMYDAMTCHLLILHHNKYFTITMSGLVIH